jgi:hypothetical protein
MSRILLRFPFGKVVFHIHPSEDNVLKSYEEFLLQNSITQPNTPKFNLRKSPTGTYSEAIRSSSRSISEKRDMKVHI